MMKKLLITFVSLLLMLGIGQVKAVSIKENDKIQYSIEKLDKLIEINTGSEWQYLDLNMYKSQGISIYIDGNSKENGTEIDAGNIYIDDRLTEILENGYGSNNLKEITDIKGSDAYLATKIAVDYIMTYKDINEFDNCYRAGLDLEEEKLQRAEGIIKAVKKLLKIANDEILMPCISLYSCRIGDFVEEAEYYTQDYEITSENVNLKGYKVEVTSDSDIKFIIVNSETNEIVKDGEFNSNELNFKIKVLRENKEGPINIIVKIDFLYDIHRVFRGNDLSNMYIIYANYEVEQNETEYLTLQEMTKSEENKGSEEEGEGNKGSEEGEEENKGSGEGEEEDEGSGEEEENKGSGEGEEEDEGSGEEGEGNEGSEEGEKKPIIIEEEIEKDQGSGGNQKDVITKEPEDNNGNNENLPNQTGSETDEKKPSIKDEEESDNKKDDKPEEERPKEEEKYPNIDKTEKPVIKEEIQDNNEESSKESIEDRMEPNKKNQQLNTYNAEAETKLPRTGKDNFIFKIILANLILFIILEILFLRKFIVKNKNTDC